MKQRSLSLQTQFLWWSESLTTQNPHPTYYAQLWLLTFLLQPLYLLGGIGMCFVGQEAPDWKPVAWRPVSSGLLCLYHLFSRVSRDKSPFPSLQVFATYGNCVWDTICPLGFNPLSLQRSPITLHALTSTVTPCHTLPTHFLPFLFACSPLLSVWPHLYSPQKLSWVWLVVHSFRTCGSQCYQEDVVETALLLDPGLCSPLAFRGTGVGCESQASFTGNFPSWKGAMILGVILNLSKAARELFAWTQWSTSCPLPLPRMSTQVSSPSWRCLQGLLHSLRDNSAKLLFAASILVGGYCISWILDCFPVPA